MKKKTKSIDWTKNLILYCNSNNAGHCPKCNSNNIAVEELTAEQRKSLTFTCKECGCWSHFDGINEKGFWKARWISPRCYSLCKTMYRQEKPVNWCQCCIWGVALADAECAADFFWDHDSSQIVHSSYDSCCLHISFSFSRRERPMCRSFSFCNVERHTGRSLQ